MGKLDGKVALITGAGSGMGQATALLFAMEGARVAVADCAPRGGQETVSMLKGVGGEAVFIETDVSSSADVKRMVATTVDMYGRIDILFNNAGIWRLAPIAETTEEDWDLVLNTNLKGVFLCSKYAIPIMINQGQGVIINTSSSSALVGSPGMSAYCASKAGVILLTKTTALEHAGQNIRVNCICPGPMETAMSSEFLANPAAREAVTKSVPLRRIGRPSEIAQTALYLACDDSSYVTGAVFSVDGGATAGIVA
ncbi:SDR family NAD(P)-dependent oxidoreductase [Chloroflexota bacterium]